jgi:hypothetical protein
MKDLLQASNFKAITPSDTDEITNVIGNVDAHSGCSLFVGTGGDIALKNGEGDSVVFKNIPNGIFLPVKAVKKVFATGTTATDIVALW